MIVRVLRPSCGFQVTNSGGFSGLLNNHLYPPGFLHLICPKLSELSAHLLKNRVSLSRLSSWIPFVYPQLALLTTLFGAHGPSVLAPGCLSRFSMVWTYTAVNFQLLTELAITHLEGWRGSEKGFRFQSLCPRIKWPVFNLLFMLCSSNWSCVCNPPASASRILTCRHMAP